MMKEGGLTGPATAAGRHRPSQLHRICNGSDTPIEPRVPIQLRSSVVVDRDPAGLLELPPQLFRAVHRFENRRPSI